MADDGVFEELTVKRINVVDESGVLRLVVSNRDRFPIPVIQGRALAREASPLAGLIFYNDLGDECGGLTYYGVLEDGSVSAGSGLNLDQFRQSESVSVGYSEENGERSAGLNVFDRPAISMIDHQDILREAQALPEGPKRDAKYAELPPPPYGNPRVFVGRSELGAIVSLNDRMGRPRIRLYVGEDDQPRLEFLDEEGGVVQRLGPVADGGARGEQ